MDSSPIVSRTNAPKITDQVKCCILNCTNSNIDDESALNVARQDTQLKQQLPRIETTQGTFRDAEPNDFLEAQPGLELDCASWTKFQFDVDSSVPICAQHLTSNENWKNWKFKPEFQMHKCLAHHCEMLFNLPILQKHTARIPYILCSHHKYR